jgi:hypothetical protein
MADREKAPKEQPKPSDDKPNTPFREPQMQKVQGSRQPPRSAPPKKRR